MHAYVRHLSPYGSSPVEVPLAEEIEPNELPNANYELGPLVRSYDTPFKWEHNIPAHRSGQTAPPLFAPDGGVVANDTRISLEVGASACSGGTIFYTCDGSTPTNRSWRYDKPFTLDARALASEYLHPPYVMVGAVASCPGSKPSPVNTRWFYVKQRVPPPIISPTGTVYSCDAVTLTITPALPGARVHYRITEATNVGDGGLDPSPMPSPADGVESTRALPESALEETTQAGCVCDFPFEYRGQVYDECTERDWPGVPWCFVKGPTCGTKYFERRFDRCTPWEDPRASPSPAPASTTAAGSWRHAGARAEVVVRSGWRVSVRALSTHRPTYYDSHQTTGTLQVVCRASPPPAASPPPLEIEPSPSPKPRPSPSPKPLQPTATQRT